MMLHKRVKGRLPQFAAARRVVLAPRHAEELRVSGGNPHLAGCVTWRKGGAQRVDGHWKALRTGVAQRGYNTGRAEVARQAVRVHQWAQWAGPGVCLLTRLGETMKSARAARAAAEASDVAAAALLARPSRRRLRRIEDVDAAAAERGRVALGRREAAAAVEEARRRRAQEAARRQAQPKPKGKAKGRPRTRAIGPTRRPGRPANVREEAQPHVRALQPQDDPIRHVRSRFRHLVRDE